MPSLLSQGGRNRRGSYPSVRPLMWFLFVRSGLPLELTLPRVVTFPQLLRARPTVTHPYRANPDGFVSSVLQTSAALFFRFEFPHHHGTLWTFTLVHISRRSYQRSPCHPKAAGASWLLGKGEADIGNTIPACKSFVWLYNSN